DPIRARIDPSTPCPKRVKLAAKAGKSFQPAFDWIEDKVAIRVEQAKENEGYTATLIRELAIEWILNDNAIRCVPERRELYQERRHFHYDIIIDGLDEFPRGFYVEMEIANCDEKDPTVNLLNAHPQRP